MDGVQRTMTVDAPAQAVRASWQTFVDEILAASERLACDQLMCVDAAAAGLVTFEAAGSETTLVTFRVPTDRATLTDVENGALRSAIDDRLRQDLIRFKDYVETDGTAAAKRARGVLAAPCGKTGTGAESIRPADPTRQA